MSAGDPVENLKSEIATTRRVLGEALVRVAEAEEESERAIEAEHFSPTEAANLLAVKAERQADADVLDGRIAALERRLVAEQERASRVQRLAKVESLARQAREHRDDASAAIDALVGALAVAADAVRTIDGARTENANIRPSIEAIADAGTDARDATKLRELSRDEAMFARAVLAVVETVVNRRPVTRLTWSDLEARRKKIE